MLCCKHALPTIRPFEHTEDSMPNARITRGLCNPESVRETGTIACAGQQGYCHCAIRAEEASAAVAVKPAEGAQAGGHPQGRACQFGTVSEYMGYACFHKELSACRCKHLLGVRNAILAILQCLTVLVSQTACKLTMLCACRRQEASARSYNCSIGAHLQS